MINLGITIRRAAADDVPEITAVANSVNDSPFMLIRPATEEGAPAEADMSSVAWLLHIRDSQRAIVVVAEVSEKIVGILRCQIESVFNGIGEISHVAVHHDFRGRGIATQMLELVVELATAHTHFGELVLIVAEVNVAAIRAYENAGFLKAAVTEERETQSGKHRHVLMCHPLNNANTHKSANLDRAELIVRLGQ